MQNPAFWARLGLLWCIFVFVACWCAGAALGMPPSQDPGARSAAVKARQESPTTPVVRTRLKVANSLAPVRAQAPAAGEPHSLPLLNGASLLLLAGLLGLGALWAWRRRQ